MRLNLLALLILSSACAHVRTEKPPVVNPAIPEPSLANALILEAHPESRVVKAGTVLPVQYVVRNVSTVEINFRLLDRGVTTMIGWNGKRMPVKVYSSMGRELVPSIKLKPGQSRELGEAWSVGSGWDPGTYELVGLIRVYRSGAPPEVLELLSVAVPITITPAR